jgi:hypothetical protein
MADAIGASAQRLNDTATVEFVPALGEAYRIARRRLDTRREP